MFPDGGLDSTPSAGNMEYVVPVEHGWVVRTFDFSVRIGKDTTIKIVTSRGVKMDGSNNSMILIRRLNDFPEDLI